MSTVLVTGGAGFIGSHIAEQLKKDGYNIKILDNFSTGKKENIKDIKAEIIKGDIRDFILVNKTMKNVDYVFHKAALISVTKSVENPILANEINVNGTLNVLKAAKDFGVKKIIFASSSSIYGDFPDKELPIKENRKPNPLSPYALTKLIGEQYFDVFYKNYGVKYVCLRYFNVYGPRQNPNSEYAAVIPKFIDSVKKNQSPTIFGDGKQSRDFIFVKDVVSANLLSMKKAIIGVFNIGSGKTMTISELASKLSIIMGKKLKPSYAEPRKGDVRHSLSDISLAKEKLGFFPTISIEEGLKETIKWFEKVG